MDRVVLTQEDMAALMDWRDEHKELVRSFPAPLKSVEILFTHNNYGWHIADLKIYDEPKELSELHHDCSQCGYVNARWDNCDFIIKHPPQSWCFVKCNVEEAE